MICVALSIVTVSKATVVPELLTKLAEADVKPVPVIVNV